MAPPVLPQPVSLTQLVDPGDLAGIDNLELLASRVVDGLLAGRHRSELKGGSAEFTEHRGYVPGDEIRLIDWKVFGKSDRYFIKQYIEQTCLQVIVVLDASGSMGFGLGTKSKFQYARAVAACLSRLVLRQSDSAGLAVAQPGPAGLQYIPPRTNPHHFQAILRALGAVRPAGEAGLAVHLTELARRIKRRGLILLLSDCFDELEPLRQAVRFLRARGHELILLHTMAPEELTLEFSGWSRFECLEIDGRHVALDPALIRNEYLDNVRTFLGDLKRLCGETGCDYQPLPTNTPVGEALALYLKRRTARLKQA